MTFKTIRQVANYKRLSECGVEELAAHLITATPSGGVMFARKDDGEEKAIARQRVLDLFAPEKWPGPLNMLTLPGLNWRFERLLLGAREPGWLNKSNPRRTHFTAVENDRAIYFAAATQMPGLETPHRLVKPVKRDRFPFAEMAWKTRYVSFFFANVDDFLKHTWTPPVYRENHVAGWDAAWLDYTGPLSTERLRTIAHFYQTYVREVLVVTALKARWNKLTSEAIARSGGHSEWLRRHLPGEVLHDIDYFDTSPMTQFAVRRKKELP